MFFASETNLDTISSQVGISLTLATEIPADHIPCSRSPSSNTTLPLWPATRSLTSSKVAFPVDSISTTSL